MGSIILTIPDIPDANLIYGEEETRRILKFFWPMFARQIDELEITNDVRRFAQTALIAAIDGSYAMGYVEELWNVVTHRITHPDAGIGELAKKLGRSFIKHWWRHATQEDLRNPRIYESIRGDVARNLRRTLDAFLNGLAYRRGSTTIAFA